MAHDDTELVADLLALYEHLGQEELSEKVGVSQQAISAWRKKVEEGKRVTIRGKEARRRVIGLVSNPKDANGTSGKDGETLRIIRGVLAMSRQSDDEWEQFVAAWQAMMLPEDRDE